MELGDEHALRFLLHDHDTKFGGAFDEIFPRGHRRDTHARLST
jgi:hypothetical protein